MSSVAYEGFRLHPPGSRKGNQFWIMRANLGRWIEISTRSADQEIAANRARQLIQRWRAEQQQAAEREIIESKCLVYFISNRTGHIKIGSSEDPLARLRELQTGSSEDLTLMAVMSGGAAYEKGLHAFFRRFRIRGEWFRRGPLLERFINENCFLEPGEILGKRNAGKSVTN